MRHNCQMCYFIYIILIYTHTRVIYKTNLFTFVSFPHFALCTSQVSIALMSFPSKCTGTGTVYKMATYLTTSYNIPFFFYYQPKYIPSGYAIFTNNCIQNVNIPLKFTLTTFKLSSINHSYTYIRFRLQQIQFKNMKHTRNIQPNEYFRSIDTNCSHATATCMEFI